MFGFLQLNLFVLEVVLELHRAKQSNKTNT